ncbi:MAG: AAA family ATPase [Colwellia sp.]|nr:AAA family ATPase [Colwellia sp.]
MDKLSPKQLSVIERILNKENIFLSGSAGTGKSLVLTTLIEHLESLDWNIAITAPTGVAAINIGGKTLHAQLGLGLAKENLRTLIKKAGRPHVRSKWENINLLIIDEISMVHPEFFDNINMILRALFNPLRPFGGIQVLFCGDFFQLPPVNPKVPSLKTEDVERPIEFCFQTAVWQEIFGEGGNIILTDIFRQQDNEFAGLLTRVRTGDHTENDMEILRSRVDIDLDEVDGIRPTIMYSLKADVEAENMIELRQIKKPKFKFDSQMTREYDNPMATTTRYKKEFIKTEKTVNQHLPVEETLFLKEEAQVMLCFNMDFDAELINGSRGIVTGFSEGNLPIVRFLNGEVRTIGFNNWETTVRGLGKIIYTQIPLRCCWACTTHKLQGSSLDLVEVALDSTIFAYGQAYVALSRIRSLEGLKLIDFEESCILTHPDVKEFYASVIE